MASTDVIRVYGRKWLLGSWFRCYGPEVYNEDLKGHGLEKVSGLTADDMVLDEVRGQAMTNLMTAVMANAQMGVESWGAPLPSIMVSEAYLSPSPAPSEEEEIGDRGRSGHHSSCIRVTVDTDGVPLLESSEDYPLLSRFRGSASTRYGDNDSSSRGVREGVPKDPSQRQRAAIENELDGFMTLNISDDNSKKCYYLAEGCDINGTGHHICTSQTTFKNQQMSSRNEGLTRLMHVLQRFGVTWQPVSYQPQHLRRESTEIFCKNLFLKDRRGQYFLIICDENRKTDLKSLRRKTGAYRNFSFATSAEMSAILQVKPGGATPFSLLHETTRDVRIVMTTDLTSDDEAWLNFHPLDENLTLPVKLKQLQRFLTFCRAELEFIIMDDSTSS